MTRSPSLGNHLMLFGAIGAVTVSIPEFGMLAFVMLLPLIQSVTEANRVEDLQDDICDLELHLAIQTARVSIYRRCVERLSAGTERPVDHLNAAILELAREASRSLLEDDQ